MQDVVDWLVRILAAVGPTGLAGKFFYDRWKGRRDRAAARVDEATIGDKIKSSSVARLEAEIVALGNAAQRNSDLKDNTITHLERQLAASLKREIEKDERIAELLGRVEELQTKLEELAADIRDLRDHPNV